MLLECLKNVSIFSNLSETQIQNLENLFTLRKYPKGSMIILEEE